MRDVFVTGLGLSVERAWTERFRPLLEPKGPVRAHNVVLSETASCEWIHPKDRKVLSRGDFPPIEAAAMAMRDAGLEGKEVARFGCVVFNTGKGVRAYERSQARVRYRTADARPNTRALAEAVRRGEAAVDPLMLLHDLDNAVLWYLCKRYGVKELNLHLTQTLAPALGALVEAVDAIAFGDCDACLVGGMQSAAASAVELAQRAGHFVSEQDDRVAGAAAFLVLEAAEPGRRSYGALSVVEGTPATDPVPGWPSVEGACPALAPWLPVFTTALLRRRHTEPVPIRAGGHSLSVTFVPAGK